LILEGHTGQVGSVAFNHDGTRVVTGSGDATARVWDVATGEVVTTLEGHAGYVRSVVFNHDGTRVVTGSGDATARVWDVATGEVVTTLEGHTSYVTSVAFNHDGTRVVTGSGGVCRAFDLGEVSSASPHTVSEGEHVDLMPPRAFTSEMACDGTTVAATRFDATVRSGGAVRSEAVPRSWVAITGNSGVNILEDM